MTLLQSNALRIPLADESVHMVCTSPPYWGLRDYGTATWEGGEVCTSGSPTTNAATANAAIARVLVVPPSPPPAPGTDIVFADTQGLAGHSGTLTR